MGELTQLMNGKMRGKLELYRDARAEWRWRLKLANSRIIAASTEGYRDKANCAGNAEYVLMREWQNPQGGTLMSNQLEKEIADLRNQQAACEDQEEAQKLSDRANQLEARLTAAEAPKPKAPVKEDKKSGKKTSE